MNASVVIMQHYNNIKLTTVCNLSNNASSLVMEQFNIVKGSESFFVGTATSAAHSLNTYPAAGFKITSAGINIVCSEIIN